MLEDLKDWWSVGDDPWWLRDWDEWKRDLLRVNENDGGDEVDRYWICWWFRSEIGKMIAQLDAVQMRRPRGWSLGLKIEPWLRQGTGRSPTWWSAKASVTFCSSERFWGRGYESFYNEIGTWYCPVLDLMGRRKRLVRTSKVEKNNLVVPIWLHGGAVFQIWIFTMRWWYLVLEKFEYCQSWQWLRWHLKLLYFASWKRIGTSLKDLNGERWYNRSIRVWN